MDYTFWIGICAGCAGFFAFMAGIEVVNDVSKRYKERYVREASTELDDVLWELPPERILDFSLLLSAAAGLMAGLWVLLTASPAEVLPDGTRTGGLSWIKVLFFSAAAGGVAFPLPRFYLRFRRRQRLLKFNEQLVDALGSISSALKAGFSINQAIEGIASEKNKPISDEFSILVREMRLGVSMEESLQKMNARLESEDFELVSAAIITARQTGGELTLVLERLASMIRERMRINGRIRALTAQGRLQAYIIGAMPYLLLVAMSYIASDMTGEFYGSPIGIGVLIVVTMLVIIGFLSIKKITTIDV